jgi:hypothetical protein
MTRRPAKNPLKHVPWDQKPDPEMTRMVREVLGIKEPKPRDDDHAPGLTDVGTPPPALMMPPPTTFRERQPDETEPAFTAIMRVTQPDLAKMPWLGERLNRAWPDFPAPQWSRRLMPFIQDNSYFFRHSRLQAVALAYMAHDLFEAKAHIVTVFNVGLQADSHQLFRDMVQWGKTFRATEIRHIARHTDLSLGKLAELHGFAKPEDPVVKIE